VAFLLFVENESKTGDCNQPTVVDSPDAPSTHFCEINTSSAEEHLSNYSHVIGDELEAVGAGDRDVNNLHERDQEDVASVTF